MVAWLLIAVVNCGPKYCPPSYTIAAYRTERQCTEALKSYSDPGSHRQCVRLDQGTMAILKAIM